MAGQLAWHFQEAGSTAKAIHYLHQAGERALQLCAFQEAIGHLTSALDLLMTQPDSPQRAEKELALVLSRGMAWMGISRSEVERAFVRARELVQQTGQTSQLVRILGHLSTMHYVRAEHRQALGLAEETLGLAEKGGDPLLLALCHWRMGFILGARGEYTAARVHLQEMIAFYEPQHHSDLIVLSGSDPGVGALANDACCLWALGYPDQARQRSQTALAIARELDHPFALAEALWCAGCRMSSMRRDANELKGYAEELLQLANEKGMPTWLGMATSFRGEALAILGKLPEALAQLREGQALGESTDVRVYLTRKLGILAMTLAEMGRVEEGMATLDQALTLVEKTGERHWKAEIHRLRAELCLMQSEHPEAEAEYRKAIKVARRQRARSWELRATVSLARLYQQQGRTEDARRELAEIYGWFTEGFDTPDLAEARALLDTLCGQ
jgi:predicted ATPase